MLLRLRTWIKENIRCGRHNLFHLRRFSVWYRGGLWHVSDGRVRLRFDHYPYLAFHDIEGYLQPRGWEPEAGEVVVDAGACFGEFAIYAAKRVGPEGIVLVLEPDSSNLEVAKRLWRLNGAPENLLFVEAGVWKESTTLFFRAGQDAISSVVEADDGSAEIERVRVETLDGLVETHGLSRVDYVKMDVEGAELEALEGAGGLLARHETRFSIASYHVVKGRPTSEELTRRFGAAGHEVSTGNPRHLTTWARPAKHGAIEP